MISTPSCLLINEVSAPTKCGVSAGDGSKSNERKWGRHNAKLQGQELLSYLKNLQSYFDFPSIIPYPIGTVEEDRKALALGSLPNCNERRGRSIDNTSALKSFK